MDSLIVNLKMKHLRQMSSLDFEFHLALDVETFRQESFEDNLSYKQQIPNYDVLVGLVS